MASQLHRIGPFVIGLSLLLTAGCFKGVSDDCEPGHKLECVCSDDSPGFRTCADDGVYDSCDCSTPDGGTSDGGGGNECPVGWDLCDGTCVNLFDDPRTCGSCTNVCGPGEICAGGNCESGGDCRQGPCSGITYCDESTGLCLPGCSENGHCPPGEYCDLGTHACDCIPGTERCGLTCTDTLSDPLHCGSCPNVCPPNATCDEGICACPVGQLNCSTTCADIITDPLHCGSCSKVCDARASCVGGECACPGSELECDGVCVDTSSDPLNCNGCDRPCPTGEACEDGSCVPPPDCRVDGCTGLTWCDQNTGVCQPGCESDSQCRTDQTCQVSNHTCVCPSGTQDCGGTCADTTTNATHCGRCNNPCPTGQACAGSICVDPSLACNTYDEGNRLTVCQNASECIGDMECSPVGFASTCLDETPCDASPAGPCCGAGEFCGTTNGGIIPGLVNVCCVPGEVLPDGLFGSTCSDAGLDIGCISDNDCPDAWGIGHCNTSVTPAICAACSSDAHCPGQRCNRPTGTCAECVGNTDCPPAAPLCDNTGTCVGCRSNNDCQNPNPGCDTNNGVCVPCTENSHCGGSTPYCDTDTFDCVACLQNSNCPASTPVCDNGACVVCPSGTTCQTMASGRRACYAPPIFPFCSQDSDCQLFAPGSVCDAPGTETLNCAYPCP